MTVCRLFIFIMFIETSRTRMKKYFYSNGQEKIGPLSHDELKQAKSISKETLIWFEGLDDWTPAIELEEMMSILELQPPPIISTGNDVSHEPIKEIITADENSTIQSKQYEGSDDVAYKIVIAIALVVYTLLTWEIPNPEFPFAGIMNFLGSCLGAFIIPLLITAIIYLFRRKGFLKVLCFTTVILLIMGAIGNLS